MCAVLSKKDILKLIHGQPPLVEGCPDIEQQLQPNGIDLTLRDISMLQTAGRLGTDNSQRVLPALAPLTFNGLGSMDLVPGPYLITYNEVVHLPADIMALGRPRSSLLRCGVTIGTAVWDAGYSGRSQSLLVVYNPLGFSIHRNARVMQLVFMRLTGETEGYRGVYQGENTG